MHGSKVNCRSKISAVVHAGFATSATTTPQNLELIDQISNGKFDSEKYQDEYRLRVRGLLDEKSQKGIG